MFRPNTPAAEFVSRHRFVKTDIEFILKKGPELSKRITAILIKK
jgi:hypothetical protein